MAAGLAALLAAFGLVWIGVAVFRAAPAPQTQAAADPGSARDVWRSRELAPLSPAQEGLARAMAQRDSLSSEAARRIVGQMSAAGFVDGAIQLGLQAKSAEYVGLRAAIEALRAQTPQTDSAARAAAAALEAGQFAAASAALEAGRQAALGSSQDGRRVQTAFWEILARLDHLAADYPAAAEKYRVAAKIWRDGDARQAWRLTMAQAGEYESQGDDFALDDALAQAANIYRGALEPVASKEMRQEWALTHYRLAGVLKNLGARENAVANLEAAVVSYRSALEGFSRSADAARWATAQNNLGAALTLLGQRENGGEDLERAVVAYRLALEEIAKDKDALRWAAIQNNLGSALLALGQKGAGPRNLVEAVGAYRAALEILSQDNDPVRWVGAQTNLAAALALLGSQENDKTHLMQSVLAYRAALSALSRADNPAQWATAQNNLGDVLRALGQRENGTERFDEAAAAFSAALTERRREKTPVEWASTQYNLGNALALAAMRRRDGGRMQMAATCFRQALEAFDQAGEKGFAAKTKASLDAAQEQIALMEDKAAKPANDFGALELRPSQ